MEVPFASATTLAAEIRAGDRSPVDVVDAYLDRICDRNDAINAYITVTADEARKAAHEAKRAIDAGEDVGPLHGVPVAIKDLTAFKEGVRHTFGCQAFADNEADHTAVFVERLEAAGAIVLGKTNLPEFGYRPTTDNLLVGPTSTPFDPEKNAGGSSGGSAAAVADGMTAIAQGGDAGGSVRIPAALCGVYGLKPTFGRIPQPARPNGFRNHTPFIDKGPLTRTVADAAVMLDVMAGPHPRDPFSVPDDGSDFVAATERGVDGLKIAYSPRLGGFPVSDVVGDVVSDAVTVFDALDADVDCIELDYGRPYEEVREDAHDPIMESLRAMVHQHLTDVANVDFLGTDHDDAPESFQSAIEAGRDLTAGDFERMNRARTTVFDAVQDVFDEYDLLVSPTLAVASVPNGVVGPSTIDGKDADPFADWTLTWPFNLTGHPAASIPAGFTDDGYPVGLQIVGQRFAETTILAASASFEHQRPWQDGYPGKASSSN